MSTLKNWDDSKRLNWLLESIIVNRHSGLILEWLGFTEEELSAPGGVSAGEAFRAAIDKHAEGRK